MVSKKPAHSKIGASSAERWFNCPASVRLLEGLPPTPSSRYADEGKAAHFLCETFIGLLKEGKPITPIWIGEKLEFKDSDGSWLTHKVDDQMYESALEYANHLLKEADGLAKNIDVEKRFEIKELGPDAFGTCDAVIFKPFHSLTIVDFKYGAGVPVSVEQNKQLLYYALGAYFSLDELDRQHLHKIVLAVHQPRVDYISEPTFRKYELPVSELLEFFEEAKQAIEETKNPDAPLRTGKWCRFCAAKPTCPAVKTEIATITKSSYEALLPVKPATFTSGELAIALDKADILDSWISEVRALALDALVKGREVPGYKLVEKKGRRDWIDKDEAAKALANVSGCWDRKLKTPKQCETSVEDLDISELVETKKGSVSIAKTEDSRPQALNVKDKYTKLIEG